MSSDHTGFVQFIKNPTQPGYVACLVITPQKRGGGSDVDAKLERNLGVDKAVEIAFQLLEKCEAPDDLLSRVAALSPNPTNKLARKASNLPKS